MHPNKDTIKRQLFDFLSDKVTSCTAVSESLGIKQHYLTWAKRHYEKKGMLQVIGPVRCPHTGRTVQGITTDPKRFKIIPVQLTLS